MPVLAEKRLAPKLENTARNFRFCPTIISHANWEISPGISILTEKRLAFKIANIARDFGSDRQTPSIRIGKYRQEVWPRPKNASYLDLQIPPGVLVLTE